MPDYDYKCSKCQEVTESFFPISDGPSPAIVCKCGGESFRQYSTFGIQLKGGGWGGQ
jgi:putative FmdB family regulatory protein